MIHHVQLACPTDSEAVLTAFFVDVVGFTVMEKPPVLAARGGVWFGGHGMQLHYGVDPAFRPAKKAHPGLLVENLDGWAAAIAKAGQGVVFDSDLPGFRRFYASDPVGNRLEFLESEAPAN
ncbi:MAG: hypothetical protein QM753_08655 [Thermomicrobiales bacterium]